MNRAWKRWQKHQENAPRASFESSLAIVIVLLVVSRFYFTEIFVGLAIPVALGALFSKKIRNLLGFFWWGFGLSIGRVTSPILMGIMYFTVLTPWSFIFRLFNSDHLRLKRSATTLWKSRNHKYSLKDMQHPF